MSLFFSFLFVFPFLLFLLDVFANGFWKDLSAVQDESLKELASRLEATVLASRAPRTTDAYRRSFARWKKFASSKSEFQHFPAKTEHVALYLQHLIDTTHSQSAVDSAIYAIQWAHTMAGIPSPTNSLIIPAIREAAKRLACVADETKPRYSPSANQRPKACSDPPRVTRVFCNRF